MALSLRRANAVKDALVRNGVPATAITVIGKGRDGPAGADRRRRARAAEPPRRDRHPVEIVPHWDNGTAGLSTRRFAKRQDRPDAIALASRFISGIAGCPGYAAGRLFDRRAPFDRCATAPHWNMQNVRPRAVR